MHHLGQAIYDLYKSFNAEKQLNVMQDMLDYGLTKHQFAQVMGKARIYHAKMNRKELPELLLSDNQMNQVVKGYLHNPEFQAESNGAISMWNFYNLLTQANKSSYIDTFLDRGENTLSFSLGIANALSRNEQHWFL